MDKSLKTFSLLILFGALMTLWGTATAQETEKKEEAQKVEVATICLVASDGGCASEGPFCCSHHQKGTQEAFQKVGGVTKVVMDSEKKKVCVEYEKGKLSLNELVQAADKAGHKLVL